MAFFFIAHVAGFRPVRGASEQLDEQLISDEDSSRAASSNTTNSASESGHGRNASNLAENEPLALAEPVSSVEPAKTLAGKRSNIRRTERYFTYIITACVCICIYIYLFRLCHAARPMEQKFTHIHTCVHATELLNC